ncbi:MAG: DNA polymerase III subunit gamma/tau [Rubrivivax sp.]
MSTVVLARKYRPKRFDQMVGQEHVVRALTHALQHNRLHHAYLFTGTRGIGKTTVSRILAKSLNCTGPDGTGGVTATPCGVCSACTEIDADRYIDYIELDAASNRSIDEIRDLIERAAYKPGVGRYKVFMIDEAHQLTKDAFNALLKTLEEPPEYLKFVLATTDPDKMLPTVLSRCLQFNLRPMAPDVVRAHLAQVLQAEQVAADEGALRLLARAARGSMRDALSLTDQAIAYGGGRLDEAVVRSMLGSVDRGHPVALLQALAARDGAAVLATVDQLRQQGLSAGGALDEMVALLQQMAVAQAVPDALDAADPDQEPALRLAPLLAADETQLLYGMVLHGREELHLCSDEYAALTMVLLRFLAFPPAGAVPAPGAVPRRAAPAAAAPVGAVPAPPPAAAPPRPVVPAPAPRAAEPEIPPWVDDGPPPEGEAEPRHAPLRAPAPAAITVPAPRATVVDAAPVTTELGDRWAELVTRLAALGRIGALVRELAWQAGVREHVAGDDGDRWTLVVERESLRSGSTPDKLSAALAAELGRPQQLVLEAGVPADSVARREAWERQRRQAEAEQIIRDDPAVQELLSQFKTARIVPGSIRPA